jgi:hypothetical protein
MWQALLIADLHAVTAFGDAPMPSAADPTLKLALDSTEVFAGAPTFLSKDTPVPAARDGQGRPLLSTVLVTLMAGTSPGGMAPSLLGFFLPIYAGQMQQRRCAPGTPKSCMLLVFLRQVCSNVWWMRSAPFSNVWWMRSPRAVQS